MEWRKLWGEGDLWQGVRSGISQTQTLTVMCIEASGQVISRLE